MSPGGAPVASSQPAQEVRDPLRGHQKYEKVNDLSSGSFGFVQLCRNKMTQELVAIKFIERGDRINRYVEAEIINHRMLRHPHVVEFKEVFLTQEYICIAMEYASGGNLFSYVQRAVHLKEPAARWFFQQLIIGLDYCHKRGVVNRDIKLENTLLQMVPGLPLPLLKICDFGYSKAHFMSAPKSKVGTLAYMAPEVIRTTGNYDGKLADIWSCGVMLYVMLFGQYPFESPQQGATPNTQRVQQMMSRILAMQWSIPQGIDISPECRDLLMRLMVADPSQRLSMPQISQHPWFLTNLPPDALAMNDNFLQNPDYTGVQSEEDIRAVLKTAQAPGSGGYNFGGDEENYEDQMIESAIEEERREHEQSFDLTRYQQGRGMLAGPSGAALGGQLAGPVRAALGQPLGQALGQPGRAAGPPSAAAPGAYPAVGSALGLSPGPPLQGPLQHQPHPQLQQLQQQQPNPMMGLPG